MGEPLQPPVPPPVKGGSGNNCLLFGCIGAAVGGVLLVLAATGVAVMGVRNFAEQYTEAEPRQLPVVTISEDEYAELSDKLETFLAAARENQAFSIALNAHEINALIQNHPDFRDARGYVYVTIEGEVIGGEISFQFPPEMPMLGGRYLNGAATFVLEVISGRPSLFFETIEVAGKTPPDELLHDLRRQNLLMNAYQDPRYAEALSRIDTIRVADGQVEIVLN